MEKQRQKEKIKNKKKAKLIDNFKPKMTNFEPCSSFIETKFTGRKFEPFTNSDF